MQNWQIALILLAMIWAAQSAGLWFQMRHYRSVMGDIVRTWSDGWVGTGNARGGFGKGVIMLLVVDSREIVRRILIMEGRSVLSKFVPLPEFEGRPLSALCGDVFPGDQKERNQAIRLAIEQIARARAKDQSHGIDFLQSA